MTKLFQENVVYIIVIYYILNFNSLNQIKRTVNCIFENSTAAAFQICFRFYSALCIWSSFESFFFYD